MKDLESSRVFRRSKIANFLEGDLFDWYLAAWSDAIEKLIRDMAARLDQYNPGTLSDDQFNSRDLLKSLYQQLFPKKVRHDLGEYYTPDWLAEHLLNELGYDGNPDKRLLDPACGSGTFLVAAISRIKQWYANNRERCGYDRSGLRRKILANVIGFDLNPLAVMAARTNYLIAIRDLINHTNKAEIPVHLCDSILGSPSFVKKAFDFVAGNPPWVNWENLPVQYRGADSTDLGSLRIARRARGRAALGKSKHELAALFLFVSADVYLRKGGKLGFVITQSLLKNKGVAGFRSLQFDYTYLTPLSTNDFVPCTVFEGAVNRTATIVVRKDDSPFSYPVPYKTIYPRRKISLPEDAALQTITEELTEAIEMDAAPVNAADRSSPWLTCPRGTYPALQNVLGPRTSGHLKESTAAVLSGPFGFESTMIWAIALR